MVSHIEGRFPKKPTTTNNIGEGLKVPQRKFWKEYLFVQYDENKNVCLLSAPIPIKSLPKGIKVLHSLIALSIRKGDCSDSWKVFALHCANGRSQIKGIYFDQ